MGLFSRSTPAPSKPVQTGPTETDCSICFETVYNKRADGSIESWSFLPCGHWFGSRCIRDWLGKADEPQCPVCRAPMRCLRCEHPYPPSVWRPRHRSQTPEQFKAAYVWDHKSRSKWLDVECGFCASPKGLEFKAYEAARETMEKHSRSIFRGFNMHVGTTAEVNEALREARLQEWKAWWDSLTTHHGDRRTFPEFLSDEKKRKKEAEKQKRKAARTLVKTSAQAPVGTQAPAPAPAPAPAQLQPAETQAGR